MILTPQTFEPVSAAAGMGFLINITTKGMLIFTLAALINIVLKNSSAAIRHWVWSLAFYSLLLLSALSFIMPEREIGLFPSLTANSQIKEPTRYSQSIATPADALENLPTTRPAFEPAITGGDDLKNGAAISSLSQSGGFITWQTGMFLIWLAGAGFFLLRMLVGIVGLVSISISSRDVDGDVWSEMLSRCKTRLNVSRKVRLKFNRIIRVPVTFGYFRPIILLPSNANEWSNDQKETVLLHEIAHIKRMDYLSNFAAQMVCALCWQVPLIWLARRGLQIERERACDDCVISEGASRCDYAGHLIEIARSLPQRGFINRAAVGATQGSELKQRIQSILNQQVPRHRLTRASIISSLIAVIFFATSLAPLRLEGRIATDNSIVHVGDAIDSIAEASPNDEPSNTQSKLKEARSVNELIEMLGSEDIEIKARAALALGERKDRQAINPLTALLKENDVRVRETAVRALGHMADKRAFYSVAEMLKDPNPQVRETTLWAMGQIGCDPAFVSITAIGLKDPSPAVRERAARLLGQFRKDDADLPFPALLRAYNPKAEESLTSIFGPVENSTIIKSLVAALNDESLTVRRAAAQSLEKLGSQGTYGLRARSDDQSSQPHPLSARAIEKIPAR